MSIFRGPRIITDGLLFGYDSDDKNLRFYKGEPTTNLSTTTETFISGVNSNLSGTWLYGAALINNDNIYPDDSKFDNAYQVTLHDANTGNWDMYRQFTPITSGTIYTFSMYVKLGTATNFCIVVNNTSAWNTVSGSKCFTSSDGLNINTYQRVSITFTAPTTNMVNIHLGRHYETLTQQTAGTVFITGVQMEAKSHPTQYLRNTSTSTTKIRSNTSGLLDLKKTSSVDLTNVSFNENAEIVFDGANDRITIPNTTLSSPTFLTIETVFMRSGSLPDAVGCPIHRNDASNGNVDNSEFTVAIYRDNAYYIYGSIGANTGVAPWTNGFTGIICNPNTYYHVVTTWDGSYVRTYVNGVLKVTYALTTYTNSNGNIRFGSSTDNGSTYRWLGEVPIVKIYKNKVLSSDDVLNNFNLYGKKFNF